MVFLMRTVTIAKSTGHGDEQGGSMQSPIRVFNFLIVYMDWKIKLFTTKFILFGQCRCWSFCKTVESMSGQQINALT